jgi:competence protein ComEC
MASNRSHFLKRTPFLKLLLSLVAGIIIQWNLQTAITIWWVALSLCFVILFGFFFIPFFNRYRFAVASGLMASLIFICTGAILTYHNDIRNNGNWFGKFYAQPDALIVTIDEPLAEKNKSYKANATISYILNKEQAQPAKGKIILYFQKDSSFKLNYGSQIIFKKSLQEIKNSGNPGGFDYKRYCLFQGITHQVYLKQHEFETLNDKNENWFRKFIYTSREGVLNILRKNIKGEKELGLSEALLIGYKDDLEQSLVQSYTNTGVVHIIAISGLHLGLIYWLLVQLFKPLRKKIKLKWVIPVFIISGLWLFSFLAGAQPSILRSAVMFTCIVLGESFSRKTSIYNTMSVSALILLCINPFWLWDVGFQLSYAAVLSIITFLKPITNWFYIKNKLLDFLWKLNAVTIAAQILTVPLSIYHFHQFPNYFLLTNFIAVPLSSAILLGEIFLCIISFFPPIALLAGKLISWLIWLMNTYIEKIESLRFSLLDGLQINIIQSILLLFFAACICYWLMEKSINGLISGLLALLGFVILRSVSFYESDKQKKIIVYNVPQKTAIDFIDGRNYFFTGDSDLLTNDFLRNFHLKPARTLFRINSVDTLYNLAFNENYFNYYGKRVLIINKSISYIQQPALSKIDLLVISKNPKVYIKKLAASLDIKQVVFDGSAPAWKTKYWKNDCDSLGIPWHDVTMKGAFVMSLR